jgi:hypothetical protein
LIGKKDLVDKEGIPRSKQYPTGGIHPICAAIDNNPKESRGVPAPVRADTARLWLLRKRRRQILQRYAKRGYNCRVRASPTAHTTGRRIMLEIIIIWQCCKKIGEMMGAIPTA